MLITKGKEMKKAPTLLKKFNMILMAGLMTSAVAMSSVSAKTLKLAYDADPISLDIHEQLSGGMLQLSHMTHDPLVRWDQNLGFEARLASKWERTDPNTVRFNLREGVKFHSGNTMTAADFKWTFDRLKTSKDFKGIFANFKELIEFLFAVEAFFQIKSITILLRKICFSSCS